MDIHNSELWISMYRVSDANFEASKYDITTTDDRYPVTMNARDW